MKISLIAAMDEKRGIGRDGKLPWHLPEDLKRFKELTIGHAVVMGRKTFDSIGRPLPNRKNIVITHNTSYIIQTTEDVLVAHSLEEALRLTSLAQGNDECFIIGGGQIFEEAIKIADKLYLTLIEGDFNCDTFFPTYSEFKKVVFEQNGESSGLKYKFVELER